MFCERSNSYSMDVYSFLLAWIAYFLCTHSLYLCEVRRTCQIMEKQYFETYGQLMFNDCDGFEQLNFTIAAYCNAVNGLNKSLQEVPVETDWLCLAAYYRSPIEAGIFSEFTNLRALYITGSFLLLPGSFEGLPQLSVLWIHSVNNLTIADDDFHGLNTLQQLMLREVKLTLNTSIFDDLYQLEYLILKSNEIRVLSTVTKHLAKLKRLQRLSIISNDIAALTINDCLSDEYPVVNHQFIDFNISYLTLDGNEIENIENNSLCNFPKLSFFKANIRNIGDIFRSGIKTIGTLSFVNAQLSIFEICLFVSNFEVQELQLMNNDIKDIDTSRGSCTNMKILDVSFNAIEMVSVDQMKKLTKVRDLNLSNNFIKILAICPKDNSASIKMELVYLNISFNFLTSLKQGQFACLGNLKVLTLNDNKIYTIEESTFSGLEKLEFLNLEYNNIYRIGEYDFTNLFSLKQLNLNENKLSTIDDYAFSDLQQLEDISLTFTNNLEGIWWSRITICRSLKKLSLKTYDAYIMLLVENFDLLNNLESLEIEARDIFVDICETFPFDRIIELHLRNNHFFNCLESFEQALEKFTNLEKLHFSADFQGAEQVVTLNSTLRNLTKLESLYLENTEKVIENSLINVDELFQGLINLNMLHLKNSGIQYFSSKVIFQDLKSLVFLIIETQNIQELKENIFSPMNNLKYIYLDETRFACSCELNWLNSWLAYDRQVSFIDFYNLRCFIRTGNVDFNLISFLDKNCSASLEFTLFLVTFISILLFMSISVVYESLWWYILYMFYTVKCWLNRRWRKEVRGQYQYDVFVSYNTLNENWVTEQLLPNLEQKGPPFFRVCIHNRDFEIGRDIVDNIVDSIYKSRWTICLITHSYLQSYWCSLEMRMATYRLVAESKDSLILIFLDKIAREELQHYHKLTKLLDKKTYLNWPEDDNGQQLFWARLRKVIGSPEREDNLEM
ncbi:uncharacterized protein LOC142502040 [Ascaphus truei]|uniref:uncharacterized protein LOC142502040 n=1 Tax=Ascaphus truei TaxID=8439 RepID=UPI003F5AC478